LRSGKVGDRAGSIKHRRREKKGKKEGGGSFLEVDSLKKRGRCRRVSTGRGLTTRKKEGTSMKRVNCGSGYG